MAVGVLFAAIGIVALSFGLKLAATAARSKGWPQAAGTVVDVRSVPVRGGYNMRVEYQFQVDGRTWWGSRLGFVNVAGDYAWTMRVRERYPIGSSVPVWYEPSNPKNCVLEPGVTWVNGLIPAFGLLFGGGGVLAIYRVRKSRVS
jgi:hypothetical protein